MSPGRMEAFSDGVMAIIITIMVLQLHQPIGSSWHAFSAVIPSFLAYLLSFVLVALYWNNHHHLLKAVTDVTGSMLWANMNLLFWLSLFPFATAWMADNGYAKTPVAIYGAVLSLAAMANYVLQTLIVRAQGSSRGLARAFGRDLKGRLSLVSNLVSIPLALVWRWGSIIIMILVSVAWIIPDRRVEDYVRTLALRQRGTVD